MKAINVSTEDGFVVDSEGTVWLWLDEYDGWSYITEEGKLGSWDIHSVLSPLFEPYIKLDPAVQTFLKRGL